METADDCVCTVTPRVYDTAVALSVKWKMTDGEEEVVWEGDLVVVVLTGNLVQTSLAKAKASTCLCPCLPAHVHMQCHLLTLPLFYRKAPFIPKESVLVC